MNKFKDISFGSDIEVFLTNEQGKNITAEGIIPGTKWDPMVIENFRTLSVDCVAAEFTINPVRDGKAFRDEINFMKDYLQKFVAPQGLKLDIFPARFFDKDQLLSETANTFGCDPDFNARIREMNERPQAENSSLRSAGMHIHFSWPGFNFDDGVKLIAACDAFLALPMMFIEPENERRKLYGKSSCVRLKSYTAELDGIEYRTLSNFGASSDELIDYLWGNIQKALEFVDSGKEIENWDEIAHVIDTNDLEAGRKLMEQLSIKI